MCGCSDEDYEPQPSAQQQYHSYQRPQHSNHEDAAEKRRRQREATQAARGYGWPTERDQNYHSSRSSSSNNHNKYARLQTPGDRDSYLDPNLNSSLAGMPDAEYYSLAPASYDARRPRQPPNPPRRPERPAPLYSQQHQRQPQYRQYQPQPQPQPRRAPAPPAPPPPPYYQQRPHPAAAASPVVQQPRRIKPMNMRVNTNASASPARPSERWAAKAAPERRPSLVVSECGSDDAGPPTGYEVSPMTPEFPQHGLPGQYGSNMRRVPGRDGAF